MTVPNITDNTSLQAAIVEYLARDQDAVLISRVPWFIQSLEAKMNRTLFVRQMEQRSTAQTDPTADEPEFIALPADFQSMRRIRLTGGADVGKPFLQYKSPLQMDEFRLRRSDIAGQPLFFTIFGNEIELAPTPDGIYTVEMIYRQNLPPLSANSTNWLLATAPDIYLYGALMEAAPYFKEDPRLQTWATLLSSAVSDLNGVGLAAEFNAGPLQVTAAGVNIW